jgi:hypothetical protein
MLKSVKNLSKTYLNAFFEETLPKNCNQEKARNPFIYAGLRVIFHDIVYIFYHCHMLPF